ncbi:hypothetical protein [Vibrio sp. 1S139]|uniref:hypothetical protein n=1 Tax=Vibrio sp. 1S139 TaxID=3230006 RepID=UPI00352CA121
MSEYLLTWNPKHFITGGDGNESGKVTKESYLDSGWKNPEHLWATTVEIVDILEGTKIKTHSHSANENKDYLQIKWEELLSIMSRYIADAEGAIELGQEDKDQFSIRLRELNDEINALGRLKTFRILSEKVEACCDDTTEHVLLMINENSLELIFSEEFDNYSKAISVYNAAEKMTHSHSGINILLISTKNMGQLSEAYPNYLGDCASFIVLLQEAMQPSGNLKKYISERGDKIASLFIYSGIASSPNGTYRALFSVR